jgi:inner membrane protein YidH
MADDDVTRRTRLANERTYLAWLRTGLTAFAVSLGAGEIVPAVTGGTKWPYTLIGAAFAVLGVGITGLAYVRERQVERALDEGGYAPLDQRIISALAAFGIVLGVGVLVITVAVN